MPDTEVAEVTETMRTFSTGVASEGLWEEPWAVWPPLVLWPPRLPLRLPPRQCVIVRCPGIGKTGGIPIWVIMNVSGSLHTPKVILADRVHPGWRRAAYGAPKDIANLDLILAPNKASTKGIHLPHSS